MSKRKLAASPYSSRDGLQDDTVNASPRSTGPKSKKARIDKGKGRASDDEEERNGKAPSVVYELPDGSRIWKKRFGESISACS